MENNQIDEGRRGLGLSNIMFDSPTAKLTMKEKLAAALTGAGIAAASYGGAYAGHAAADAIRDPKNNPQLLEPLTYDDGTPMKRRSGKPVTAMSQTYSIAEPAGALLGFGTGLVAGGHLLAGALNRRRNSSPSQPLKEHYKETLLEAIRNNVTSRTRQTVMRKLRGIDRTGKNRVTPMDHPILDTADPRNRAMLRAGFSDAAAEAHGRAIDSAINAEFGMPKYPMPRA